MSCRFSWVLVVASLWVGSAALAQEQVWVQIEAQPTPGKGEERARAYASAFPNAVGFRLNSGWYAVALGPFSREAAAARLAELKAENLIPGDSYLTDGKGYLEQFWPPAGSLPPANPPATAPTPDAPAPDAPAPDAPAATAEAQPFTLMPVPGSEAAAPITAPPAVDPAAPAAAAEPAVAEPATPEVAPPEPAPVEPEPAPADPAPAPVIEETPQEARASEAAMTDEGRMGLQSAMQWFGFYQGKIDGAFGKGTRGSMAAWQEANGFEPTGILTSHQREVLMGAYQAEEAAFGFDLVTETEAGIEISLPLAMVGFDHYDPPFVHFTERNGSGLQVILISQPGDQAALAGLYDVLQTLEVVPKAGERSRQERSFTISGRNDHLASFTHVEQAQGLIKGYLVVWNPQDDARMDRVLSLMEASFRPVGDRALDPGMVPLSDADKAGLLAGLEVRKPRLSRSGFYVSASGQVLTVAEAVAGCGSVTIDGSIEASVTLQHAALGLALLTPAKALAPAEVASFADAPLRVGADIAVSGYSYQDRLAAPVLSFGSLAGLGGLEGETGFNQFSVALHPGDAGGPVLGPDGSVQGMVLAAPANPAKLLPPDVAFAATPAALGAALAAQGVTLIPAIPGTTLPPDALARRASGMTVLVSCWE